MRILVIEDEPRMLELLRRGLRECGFAVMGAADGEEGFEIATNYDFDAILLDIGLPRRDGYELTKLLRERARFTPVLMLTARDSEDDMIRGFDLGADDYLTKPFSFPELVARLQSISRPHRKETGERMEAADLVIDPIRRVVSRRNETIDLSRSEFRLLECLVRCAGECVSRKMLMDRVWGSNHDVGQGALDVLVNSLRGKIDAPYTDKLICTVRGAGYLLRKHPAGVVR